MTADPRVEAVTAARAQHRPLSAGWLGGVRCSVCDWEDRALLWPDHLDAVAVAALDAYAEGSDLALMVQRERIAQAIDAEAIDRAHAVHDPQCADCAAIAALTLAARIARGKS